MTLSTSAWIYFIFVCFTVGGVAAGAVACVVGGARARDHRIDTNPQTATDRSGADMFGHLSDLGVDADSLGMKWRPDDDDADGAVLGSGRDSTSESTRLRRR